MPIKFYRELKGSLGDSDVAPAMREYEDRFEAARAGRIATAISFASFRSSRVGRRFTHYFLKALEACRVAPRGTVSVTDNLGLCASALVEGGRLGVFTPMYFIHARKPG